MKRKENNVDSFTFRGEYCNLSAQDPAEPKKTVVVKLYESTWKLKTSKPERSYLIYNVDKIKATLSAPDIIIRSQGDPKCLIYCRKNDNIRIKENITVPPGYGYQYFSVVISKRTVRTIYPTDKLKQGEKVWEKQPSK